MSPIEVDINSTTHTSRTSHPAGSARAASTPTASNPTASNPTVSTSTAATSTTPTTAPRLGGTSLPIRRLGAMEIPAPGRWPLQTTSYVAHPSKRGTREQLAVCNGWLDLDNDPAQCWLHIELADRVLDLTVSDIHEDPYGLSAWQMTGIADDGTNRLPMTTSLRYHGVFRRNGEMWAWFSGTGVVERHDADRRSARRAAERLHLDLLFDARSAATA